MSRDLYRQGADDAQHYGEPNPRLYLYPSYEEGFNKYMREHPLNVEADERRKEKEKDEDKGHKTSTR